MISWAALAPQIVVAVVIVVTVVFLLRVVMGMAKAMTKPAANGKRESRLEVIEGEVSKHGRTLEGHTTSFRKVFAAVHTLRKGQTEILEHLTNGQPSTTADIPPDIDAADTGTHPIYRGEDG